MGDTERDVRRAQGRRLREARKTAGLSLVEVVAKLRDDEHITLTPQAVSAWERGETTPRAGTRDAVCRILAVEPTDIFGVEL
jgi:transcriptional regulator with XRE-family HTH domain